MTWSPQVSRHKNLSHTNQWPSSRVETTSRVHDGSDAGADMKMLGAVCEESVMTIGLDGETLAEEESRIDDVNGGFLDTSVVSQLVSVVLIK